MTNRRDEPWKAPTLELVAKAQTWLGRIVCTFGVPEAVQPEALQQLLLAHYVTELDDPPHRALYRFGGRWLEVISEPNVETQVNVFDPSAAPATDDLAQASRVFAAGQN